MHFDWSLIIDQLHPKPRLTKAQTRGWCWGSEDGDSVALDGGVSDLHVEFVAADSVPSGEGPMGDNPADAASASPRGGLPRVAQICRVFSLALLSALLVLSHSCSLPSLSVIDSI